MSYTISAVPMSVLAVDDDADILNLVAIVLRRAGLSVETVGSGGEAIERLSASGYDAVVLDLTMPHVSGFEVLAHLKRENPAILRSVVVITAMSDTAIRRLDRSLVYTVLAKPFDIVRLTETVLACGRDAQTRRAAQADDAITDVQPLVQRATEVTPSADTPAPLAESDPNPLDLDARR